MKHRGTIGLVRDAHNLKVGSSSLLGARFYYFITINNELILLSWKQKSLASVITKKKLKSII